MQLKKKWLKNHQINKALQQKQLKVKKNDDNVNQDIAHEFKNTIYHA